MEQGEQNSSAMCYLRKKESGEIEAFSTSARAGERRSWLEGEKKRK
jgi:hypothetical protein